MKKKKVWLMVPLLVAGLLTACSRTKTVTGADSSAVKTDSTQTMSTSSADSTTAMADTTFAAKAAISGMAEVDLGKVAAAKGTAKEVKDFGQMMVMDHGKANAELMSIAKNKNITLPADWMQNTRPRATA